jgi:tetratricopeptide (TPR) repeat protein
MTAISEAHHPRHGPFVGARPFDARDEALFFGRTEEIAELTDMWRHNRLTILHSDAAAGKTSLLRAGIIPALRSANERVLPIGRASSSRVWPTPALPDHNPYVLALLSSWGTDEPPSRIAGLSVDDFLRKRGGTDRHGAPEPTLAAIDQVETFLRQASTNEHHRCRFLDELFETLDERPNLRLLLSVRTDYLDELLRVVKGFGGHAYAEFCLRPFTPETAAEVIRLSSEATGNRSAPDQVKGMLDELRTIRDETGKARERTFAIDPLLLQVVGAYLWGDPPAFESFAAAEPDIEVDRALGDFCARMLAAVAADYELSPSRLHAWLRRAVLFEGGRGAWSPAKVTATVVHALEDRHLIRAPHQNGLRMHAPRQRRLLGPLRRLDAGQWPPPPAGSAHLLRAALQADFEGEPDRAHRLAQEAARVCPPEAMRTRAEIESLLGNLAYEQGLLDEAITRYHSAAGVYEALHDSTAVGWLLAAVGRIALAQGRQSTAIEELRAAVSRVPHDPLVQTSFGQALWEADQPRAALSVLSGVLDREGDAPEARRTRGEILAHLGDAESALRDIEQSRSRRPQPSTRVARALALATLSRTEAASRELDGAVTETEDSGPLLLSAARARKLIGDITGAARLIDRAKSAQHPPLPQDQLRIAERLLEDS